MLKINFTKMMASGNDFVVIDNCQKGARLQGYQSLARSICNRKYGIGADGLLVLEKSRVADIRMRIFNPDGSEAQMCGNGARCVALYVKSKIKIETKAGVIESEIKKDNVKIKLTEPKQIKLDIPIKLNYRKLKVNFINTGVPHTVVFVEGLEKIEVLGLGRQLRYHQKFSPQGTNVDFVEVLSDKAIKIRTYERGVEEETLACGTGAVAAALLTSLKINLFRQNKINVQTRSGEILRVYFRKINKKFTDVWLEGKARIVYKGVYDV